MSKYEEITHLTQGAITGRMGCDPEDTAGRRKSAHAEQRVPPKGGTAAEFSSGRFAFRWKQAFRGGTGAALLTEAKDIAIVSMRGHDNRNASRLKTYGRFSNGS